VSGTEPKVAVVTGASRGAGKGIALALGATGMTVYVTGRSTSVSLGRLRDTLLPGTILETAAQITALGGRGVAVACDHRDDAAVQAAFERVASYFAAPLMVRAQRGLIAFTSSFGASCYMHGPAYGAQKVGVDKFAADMAVELAPHGVAAVSLWLGPQLTERTAAAARSRPEQYAEFLRQGETPQFNGRIIYALARDPALQSLSGQTLISAEVARRYGITEEGGREPPSYRELLGSPRVPHPAKVM
jgi:NAD(P)-dependent dehydrogenase (short-subunit alcohol dehydrogenase family)